MSSRLSYRFTMSSIGKFNKKLASVVTGMVSTMWCAYIFAAIALISLPSAIKSGDTIVIVAWIAQTFLQLVLLSIIMVGQSVQSEGVAQKIEETHFASLGEFELAKEARLLARQELVELKSISLEVHQLVRDLERKIQ
ncbi:unannotated protein [freshwater metagenome]|uniref:Unannotated protein n=1 Tax=freshwater metagenome TaxID=449393 RepID=A0A6J6VPJ1_9ZZZZ